MYQIGDKINIKFKEEKKETSIEQTFNDILSALNSSKLCQSEKLREILENARLNKSTNKFNSNSQTA